VFFRKNPAKTEFIGNRETPSGASLFVRRADQSGRQKAVWNAHSTPDKAPPENGKAFTAA